MNTEIQQLADQCVKCGLCLPKCPTYQLSANESESPRGRIAIIQALDNGQIEATEKGRTHLDHCLQCMACESVCPAEVSYGKLIDAGMAMTYEKPRRLSFSGLGKKVSDAYFLYPIFRRTVGTLIRLYQKSGLQRVLGLMRLPALLGLSSLERLIPQTATRMTLTSVPASKAQPNTQVVFHAGCVSSEFDGKAADAAIKLLAKAGFDVEVPKATTCCGALHHHAGDKKVASKLERSNSASVGGNQCIVSPVSGCASFMASQGLDAQEVVTFLVNQGVQLKLKSQPHSIKSVYLQEPCTHKNGLKNSDLLKNLIRGSLPKGIVFIEDTPECCGASGTYLVRYPETAEKLGKRKHRQITTPENTLVISTNIGCAMHLRALPGEAPLMVKHPAEMLEIA